MSSGHELFREIGRRILQWWYENKRDYPWRHERDPYRILIAEIMLQRTKAEQVVPVYVEFISRYPTVQDLARARPEDVEEYFARLGLRWRAKKVLAMAKYVTERLGGMLPETEEGLIEVPAVGDYMADALSVFAYGRDRVVVDANVVRIVERLFFVRSRGEGRRDPRIRQLANSMLVPGKSREFNWALIDFGALVCRPAKPLCGGCPLSDLCRYRGQATVLD
jgi:A/G-specific adenine glycosylase